MAKPRVTSEVPLESSLPAPDPASASLPGAKLPSGRRRPARAANRADIAVIWGPHRTGPGQDGNGVRTPSADAGRAPAPAGRRVKPPTGDAGVAVANCVSGPRNIADWIVSMFGPFAGTLAEAEGHREFSLLEVVHRGPDCCYVSLSTWDSLEDFSRWQAQGSFREAHDAARADRKRFRELRPARRYDLPDQPLADLTAPILARVGADYPGVRAQSASLRAVVLDRHLAEQREVVRTAGRHDDPEPAAHAHGHRR